MKPSAKTSAETVLPLNAAQLTKKKNDHCYRSTFQEKAAFTKVDFSGFLLSFLTELSLPVLPYLN